nr:MAG TPA: hypothetical protein [Caudoviricetes sp.]
MCHFAFLLGPRFIISSKVFFFIQLCLLPCSFTAQFITFFLNFSKTALVSLDLCVYIVEEQITLRSGQRHLRPCSAVLYSLSK